MQPTHAGRETKPKPSRVEAAPEIPPLRIPKRALTPAGFRAWLASDPCPHGVRLSYEDDGIAVDFEEAGIRLHVPAGAATLDGFLDWMEHDDTPHCRHVSFIDPEILIDMNGEEIETHNKLKAAVTASLYQLVEDLDIGEFLADGAMYSNPAVGLANAPDASFIKWEASETGRVRLVARRTIEEHVTLIEGAPDWVLEVVSQSSVGKDMRDLRTRYRRAGVPEYWLIDARGAEIDFQMLVLRGKRYAAVRPRDGWRVSPTFGRSFLLERRRNRAGRWQYRLHHQPA